MIEDRPRRPAGDTSAGAALAKRLRGWLGLSADPALPRPRTVRLEPVRRSWPSAFWQARISVRAGVPLDDYLRSRLARYLAALSVPRDRLPVWVDVEEGQVAVRPLDGERRPQATEPPAPDAWLAPLVAAEGPAVRQEVGELELRLVQLEGEADAARRRTEELSRRLAADVAAGFVQAPGTVEATSEQLGRPALRSAVPQNALLTFAAAAAAAETWQIALPFLRGMGIDPATLGQEAARRPADVAFAAVFALGISAGLFALVHAALQALSALTEGGGDARRNRWLVAAASGAGLLAVTVATALAALPPHSKALPAWSTVVLLVAVPVGVSLVLRVARALAARRDAEATAALAWDRERAKALGERARRFEELTWGEARERELERDREAARRRLREISARASTAARYAARAAERERAALSRVAQSLIGALELDRYEFARQATARGAEELLHPRRRPAAQEPRPARMEVPPLTPAVVTVGSEAGGAGRMAS